MNLVSEEKAIKKTRFCHPQTYLLHKMLKSECFLINEFKHLLIHNRQIFEVMKCFWDVCCIQPYAIVVFQVSQIKYSLDKLIKMRQTSLQDIQDLEPHLLE